MPWRPFNAFWLGAGGSFAAGLAALCFAAMQLWTGAACDHLKESIAIWPLATRIGCAEFWANRYQTLIAGLIATGAAMITVYFTRKQITQAQEQFHAQLRVQTYIMRIEVDRETEVFLAPLNALIAALEAHDAGREKLGTVDPRKAIEAITGKPPTDGLVEYMVNVNWEENETPALKGFRKAVEALVAGRQQSFERVRMHMRADHLQTADRFFSGLKKVQSWPATKLEPTEPIALRALLAQAREFRRVLMVVRRTAEDWLSG